MGRASIVLVFVLLCLSIFTVISFSTALTEHKLIQAELKLVKAYYAADALAEQILADILIANEASERVSFAVAISETKELHVIVDIKAGSSYEILKWQMAATGEWQADGNLNVWQGF